MQQGEGCGGGDVAWEREIIYENARVDAETKVAFLPKLGGGEWVDHGTLWVKDTPGRSNTSGKARKCVQRNSQGEVRLEQSEQRRE